MDDLFSYAGISEPQPVTVLHLAQNTPAEPEVQPDLDSYDYYVFAFSGGKDSLACLLHGINSGIPLDKIELWHHDIDGREGSTLMDWPVTRDYCRRIAEAFGLPIYFSWKEGGFEREMLRSNAPTARNIFETPYGVKSAGGNSSKVGTRLRFPQVSADLSVRWCSAYLKVDVSTSAVTNQERFLGKRTLFITGERAQESSSRANYKTFEPHRTDRRNGTRKQRHVDHWRPIHKWREEQVWDIIEEFRVAPHPAYDAGFGRVSCMNCIFMSPSQAATIQKFAPERLAPVASYEADFGCTIHRTLNVLERAAKGTPYEAATSVSMAKCLSETFDDPIIRLPGTWVLPAGAFGESCGPT